VFREDYRCAGYRRRRRLENFCCFFKRSKGESTNIVEKVKNSTLGILWDVSLIPTFEISY